VSDIFRVQVSDLAALAEALGRILPRESDPEDALLAVGLEGKADFRGGRSLTRWQAVLEAVLDAEDDTLVGLLEWVTQSKGERSRRELRAALDEAAKATLRRAVRAQHPDFNDQAEALLSSDSPEGIRQEASDLRASVLAIRRVLADPVLSSSVVGVGAPFTDPYEMRMALADLAIDAVTALDYLLANLGASEARASQPWSLTESVDRLPAHDDEAADRRLRRQLDARAAAVRLVGRLFSAVRKDFVV
jgi:hypothetical protein